MKLKAIVKVSINPLLLVISAVLMFLHLFLKADIDAWYCRDFEKNISIILLSGFIYRTRQYKHGYLNNIHKCIFIFFLLKCSCNISEELLAWLHNIHLHTEFLLGQLPFLTIISLLIVYFLLKGGDKEL